MADFRDLKAGDRPAGTARGTGPVIVEGVPAVERLLASPYRVRAVFGVPGRVAALDLPEGVRRLRGRQVGAVGGDRLPAHPRAWSRRRTGARPRTWTRCSPVPIPAAPRRLAVLEGLNDAENLGSIARSAVALGHRRPAARPAVRRPSLPPVGAGLDGARAGPAVRRPPRVARRPGAAARGRLHDRGAHPGRRRRRPRDVDAVAHPRTAVLLGRGGSWPHARGAAGSQVRARIPMRRGVDSLGVAAAAAIAFATLR